MEKIRLQKFFTDMGIMSRRASEKVIEAGNVKVNGQINNSVIARHDKNSSFSKTR